MCGSATPASEEGEEEGRKRGGRGEEERRKRGGDEHMRGRGESKVSLTRIMESVISGRSSSTSVLRMGQPLPMKCIPSAVSWVQPERSRCTRRRQPLPATMECSPLVVKWVQ